MTYSMCIYFILVLVSRIVSFRWKIIIITGMMNFAGNINGKCKDARTR